MKNTYFTESTTTVKVQSFYNKKSKTLVNYMDNTVFINTLDTYIVDSGKRIELDLITEETLLITGLDHYKSILVYANGVISAKEGI